MKNYKLYNKIGLLTGGFVLSESLVYGIVTISTGIAPLKPNKHEAYKVYSKEYTKIGVFSDENYIWDDSDLDYNLKIRTPYYEDSDNHFKRDVYIVKTILDKEDEEYIINNVNNQELVLNNSTVQKIVSELENKKLNSKLYYKLESQDRITFPIDNNFEVSYFTYECDKNDTIMVDVSQEKINDVNYIYGISSILMLFPFTAETAKILDDKDKQKKLKKEYIKG